MSIIALAVVAVIIPVCIGIFCHLLYLDTPEREEIKRQAAEDAEKDRQLGWGKHYSEKAANTEYAHVYNKVYTRVILRMV